MNKVETNNLLSSLLDPPITCNKNFAKITGLLSAGTLLTHVVKSITLNTTPIPGSGEIFVEIFQSELGMSDTEIYSAKRRLRHLGFVETKNQGSPIKTLYMCHTSRVQAALVAQLNEVQNLPEHNKENQSHVLQQRCKITCNNNIRTQEETKEKTPSPKTLRRRNLAYSKEDIWYQLAELLLNQILKRRPDMFGDQGRTTSKKDTKVRTWARDFDIMMDKAHENRDAEEVLDLILWSQKDLFWQKVITSAAKFRAKFGQLSDYKGGEEKNDKELPKDAHPEMTEKIIKLFVKEILGGRTPKWSALDMGKFIRASRRISGFAKETNLSIGNVSKYVVRCMKTNYVSHGKPVYPGNLCSDNTWNILMPQYLKELGIIYRKDNADDNH